MIPKNAALRDLKNAPLSGRRETVRFNNHAPIWDVFGTQVFTPDTLIPGPGPGNALGYWRNTPTSEQTI